MKKLILTVLAIMSINVLMAVNPVLGLIERIDKGASDKFIINISATTGNDYFQLAQKGDKVVITANDYVCAATGLNWYLKYYCDIHITWNQMKAKLPSKLPRVNKVERHETNLKYRYDFNYCTFSYSMAFWNWDRWQQEIDWMALHGINMPLDVVGTECVWRNMLLKLGYTKDEIGKFISGPAFMAWWEMNNLEGWGGPNPDSWYMQQEKLNKQILKRMKEFGIHPVFPGYSGMVPHDAKEKLGLDVAEPGLWNGYLRPAFLLPTDARFNEIADLYYREQKKLFGVADYYSMDPFHESSSANGIDFDAAGKAIMNAMKRVNPRSVWVVQGWDKNPRNEMIQNMKQGDLFILDLFSECRPQWGQYPSLWYRENGYLQHNWAFCMLENFGANVGLHGRLNQLLENYQEARKSPKAKNLVGIGLTMEGSENNPMMFELMTELPWRSENVTKSEWLRTYLKARYGRDDETINAAWNILADGILNCPRGNNQQGPHESIFCGRPSLNNFQVSSWSKMENYYDPTSTADAARLMLSVADKYRGNNNFEYDLVDIVRQSISDHGRILYNRVIADFKSFDRIAFSADSTKFLNALLAQDRLLATRQEFRVGNWIEKARSLGNNKDEKDLYEWNARVQITTWGARTAAETGGLRDYAHKEWNGILKDFYYVRWQKYLNMLSDVLYGKSSMKDIDWYAIDEPWTKRTEEYSAKPEGDVVNTAKSVFTSVIK